MAAYVINNLRYKLWKKISRNYRSDLFALNNNNNKKANSHSVTRCDLQCLVSSSGFNSWKVNTLFRHDLSLRHNLSLGNDKSRRLRYTICHSRVTNRASHASPTAMSSITFHHFIRFDLIWFDLIWSDFIWFALLWFYLISFDFIETIFCSALLLTRGALQ